MIPGFAGSNPYFLVVFLLALAGSPIVLKVCIDSLEDSGVAQVAPLFVGYALTTLLAFSLATTGDVVTSPWPHLVLLVTAVLYTALLIITVRSTAEDDQVTSADELVQERL